MLLAVDARLYFRSPDKGEAKVQSGIEESDKISTRAPVQFFKFTIHCYPC